MRCGRGACALAQAPLQSVIEAVRAAGPTGRRAGLMGGPDVWEVAIWVDDLHAEADPAATLVTELVLARPQIDAALRYRTAYPDELAARIELHR